MNTFRANADRAKNAIIFIGIVTSLKMIYLIFNIVDLDLYKRVVEQGVYTMEEIENSDFRNLTYFVVYVIVYIFSAIAFIMWFRRAYYNLKNLGVRTSCDEGWAAGAWFVPIMNLFRPYQIMRELYQVSDMYIKSKDENHKPNKLIFVGWWWALWIFTGVFYRILNEVIDNTEYTEHLIVITNMEIVINLIMIPLAICTIRVIKDYVKIEERMKELYNTSFEKDEDQVIAVTGESVYSIGIK
ncbi:MAG: DUF4328 domain-containing protein [Bacteroidales bacterium]|jgi:hypothetical protein|nr:DUF4328 domain-containing protein [Bacteroidales bacterium]